MIVYFSGTGNTRFCAEKLAKLLGDDQLVELGVAALRSPRTLHLTVKGQRVVWMFGVHAWGVPPVIAEVMRRCHIAEPNGTPHWMVATCGDDTGRTARQWRSLMRQAEHTPATAFAVKMPNTYTCMRGFDVDSPEVEQAKIDAVDDRLKYIADLIIANAPNTPDDALPGKWPWLKSMVARPWFNRFRNDSWRWHATDACQGCGWCSKACPMENIHLGVGRRPNWGDSCAMCMRCYHGCPNNAIHYDTATQGKGHYRRFFDKK